MAELDFPRHLSPLPPDAYEPEELDELELDELELDELEELDELALRVAVAEPLS
jgi:hypothetical protein